MSAQPQDNLSTIGEVLAALKAEFPEVTVSKIRFLEAEALVTPVRTSSGYRKFSHADVERLRYVLRAQRDRYLPLKVIKDELDAIDRGLSPTGDGRPQPPRALVAVEAEETVALKLKRAELLEASGVDESTLRTLEQYALLAPDSRGFYGRGALNVCLLAFELQAYGIEPRHLRTFKVSADREASLLSAVVAPYAQGRSRSDRSQAEDMARSMAALATRLHSELLHSSLSQSLNG